MLVNGENESSDDIDSGEDDSEEESSDEDQETPETQKVRTHALSHSGL